MSLSKRYEILKDKVKENEYRRKDFQEKITKYINDVVTSINNMDDYTKSVIIARDSRFLNEGFLNSIKDMDYEQILEVKRDLNNLLNSIITELEASIE